MAWAVSLVFCDRQPSLDHGFSRNISATWGVASLRRSTYRPLEKVVDGKAASGTGRSLSVVISRGFFGLATGEVCRAARDGYHTVRDWGRGGSRVARVVGRRISFLEDFG